MMKSRLLMSAICACFIPFIFGNFSYAAPVDYVVSDAVSVPPHGLWFTGLYAVENDPLGSSSQVYLSFDSGSSLLVGDDLTATLSGITQVSDLGGGPGVLGDRWEITIDLAYRGTGPDGEGSGGPKYLDDPNITDNWEYYDLVSAVMSNVADPSDQIQLIERPLGGVYPFQLGLGASGKNLDFGASVELSYTRSGAGYGNSGYAGLHVDLDVAEVPLPATVWLFGSGLLGLVGITRRKKGA